MTTLPSGLKTVLKDSADWDVPLNENTTLLDGTLLPGKRSKFIDQGAAKTANYSMGPWHRAAYNAITTSITQALPTSPSAGDEVQVYLASTTVPNTLTLTGAGGPFVIRRAGHGLTLQYSAAQVAWVEAEDRKTTSSLNDAYAKIKPVRFDELGARNPWGVKIRGANMAPNPAIGDGAGNFGHWHIWLGSGYSLAFIQQQIGWLKAVNANATTVYYDIYEVLNRTTSFAVYKANVKACFDEILKAGLYLQPSLFGWGSGTPTVRMASITGLTGANSIATVLPYIVELTALADSYPNCIGMDLVNESNMWFQTATGVTPIDFGNAVLPSIRAVTSKPLTMSYQMGTANEASTMGSNAFVQWVAANLDYLNFHPYYGTTHGFSGASPAQSHFQSIANTFPGKAIVIGELGSGAASNSNTALAPIFPEAQKIWEMPEVAGGFFWSINNFQAGSVPSALFVGGVEQTVVAQPFRTLPRRTQYEHITVPLGGAGASLASTLTAVSNAYARVGQGEFAQGQSRDAQYRLVVTAAVTAGDAINAQLVDTASSVLLTAAGNGAGTAPSTADSGPNTWTPTLNGNISTLTAASGFSNALYLNQSGSNTYVDLGMHAQSGAFRFTVEMWIRRTRTGVSEIIYGTGGSTGYPHSQLYFDAGNRLVGVGRNSAGALVLTGTTVLTDTTNWHHIALTWDTGSTLRVYLDGVLEGSGVAAVSSPGASETWELGNHSGGGFYGYVDELRISNTARYTGSTLTVPSAPFSSDANTVALFHMDAITGGGSGEATTLKSPWTYVPPSTVSAQLKLQNVNAARGTLVAAYIQARLA